MTKYFLLFTAVACAAGYVLYRQGIAQSKCIAAAFYVFLPGRSSDRVAMDSCNGWVRRMGKFREARTYEFTLDTQLSNGDVEVFLLDQEKQEILRLNPYFPSQQVSLSEKSRYYIHWEFRNATGKCELNWQ